MKYVSTTTTTNNVFKKNHPNNKTYLANSPGSVISLNSKFGTKLKPNCSNQNSISNSTTFSNKTSKQNSCCCYNLFMKCFHSKNKTKASETNNLKLRRLAKSNSFKRQESYRSVAKRFRRSFEISNSVQMSRFINRDNLMPSKLNIDYENGIESPIFLNSKTSDTNIEDKFVFDTEITQLSANDLSKKKNLLEFNSKSLFLNLSNNRLNDNNNNNEKIISRKGFMNKQEKAFKQLSAIVFGFTLCFLPYFIVFMVVAVCEECISEEVFTVAVWVGYLNSTINPWIYALSNKRRFLKPFSKRITFTNQPNKKNEMREIKLSNFSISKLYEKRFQ